MSDPVADEMEAAREALADAQILQTNDGTDAAVVNRLYYACFHATRAVLYDRGHEPASHQGVTSLFGEKIVLVGDASREDGRFLSELYDQRQRADYHFGPLSLDTEELYDRACEFVEKMDGLL